MTDPFEMFGVMNIPLPEGIAHLVGMGDFEEAEKMINAFLKKPIAEKMKMRLEAEKKILVGLSYDYTDTFDDLLSKIRAYIPEFSALELKTLEEDGVLDFIFYHGERRYFRRQCQSLMNTYRDIAVRAGRKFSKARPVLDNVIAEMKINGGVDMRLHIKATVNIDHFTQGETYRLHLPLPKTAAQQTDIELLSFSDKPFAVADATAAQRTVLMQKTMKTNTPFTAEYAYAQRPRYCDPFGAAPASPVYPTADAPTEYDLNEKAPHIVFTPYLKALAAEITGAEKDPMTKAGMIYHYITENVKYSFMRAYRLVENGAEYAAINLKGDCGIQALLFITLCRICGIPARWQSGLDAMPDDIGSHDWAQFYVAPFGWLFADCSFGGSAFRAGSKERQDFYFGNLDPYRMVANSDYYAPFEQAKKFMRCDPYDNQQGEVETRSRGLTSAEFTTNYEMLSIEKI